MDGWMDEWMDGWMNEWMNEWMDGWMNEWINEWVSEWMNEFMYEWMNECMHAWMDATNVERKNQSMNKWMNKWVSESKFTLLRATLSSLFSERLLLSAAASLSYLFSFSTPQVLSYFSGSRHLAALFVSTLFAESSLTTSVIHVFTSCSHDGEFSNIFATQSSKSGPTMQWDARVGTKSSARYSRVNCLPTVFPGSSARVSLTSNPSTRKFTGSLTQSHPLFKCSTDCYHQLSNLFVLRHQYGWHGDVKTFHWHLSYTPKFAGHHIVGIKSSR